MNATATKNEAAEAIEALATDYYAGIEALHIECKTYESEFGSEFMYAEFTSKHTDDAYVVRRGRKNLHNGVRLIQIDQNNITVKLMINGWTDQDVKLSGKINIDILIAIMDNMLGLEN